ncbi:MAG: hypothetical protein ACJZ2G_05045 [Thalassobaculaceae bacterium]
MLKNKFLIYISSMLFLAIVSGCSSRVTEDRICPTVAFVDGLEQMTLFRDTSNREASNILFISQFSSLNTKCSFSDDGADIETSFLIKSSMNDAKKDTAVEINYFAAAIAPDGSVLSKKNFDLEIPFSKKNTEVTQKQIINPFFPKKTSNNFAGYKLLIGFQLNKSQVTFNLRHRR